MSDASWDQDTLEADELDLPIEVDGQLDGDEREETVQGSGRSTEEVWTDLGLEEIVEATQASESTTKATENHNQNRGT